jgi:hypothetical protein
MIVLHLFHKTLQGSLRGQEQPHEDHRVCPPGLKLTVFGLSAKDGRERTGEGNTRLLEGKEQKSSS